MTLQSIEKYFERYTEPRAYPWVSEMLRDIQDEVDSRYMELPVDRNGEPWNIGDKFAFSGADGRKHICTVSGVSDNEVFFYYDEHSSSTKHRHFTASAIAHVNPRTVEDVLVEFYGEFAKAKYGEDSEVLSHYATELRDLMGVDDD